MEARGSSVVDVQRYLVKDERVVWSAQPVRKFFLKYLFSQDPSRFLGYYFIVFGFVFALMPLLVFVSMPPGPRSKGEPPIILFAVFGLFFAGMGYVLSFGRRRRVIKQLGNTAYYLTNARAFIVSGADDSRSAGRGRQGDGRGRNEGGRDGSRRGQAWGSPNRFLDLWRDALHLLRHPVGIHGSADHARRDEKQELGLLDLLLGGPEEIAEHGDAVEQRDARADEGALVLDEAAQDEGLVVEEHH